MTQYRRTLHKIGLSWIVVVLTVGVFGAVISASITVHDTLRLDAIKAALSSRGIPTDVERWKFDSIIGDKIRAACEWTKPKFDPSKPFEVDEGGAADTGNVAGPEPSCSQAVDSLRSIPGVEFRWYPGTGTTRMTKNGADVYDVRESPESFEAAVSKGYRVVGEHDWSRHIDLRGFWGPSDFSRWDSLIYALAWIGCAAALAAASRGLMKWLSWVSR